MSGLDASVIANVFGIRFIPLGATWKEMYLFRKYYIRPVLLTTSYALHLLSTRRDPALIGSCTERRR